MAFKIVSLTALLVLGVLFGKTFADEPEGVVGGTNAFLGEFPYQVSLRIGNFHICGGSIISNRHIVTAAHCVHDSVFPPYTDFTVHTGTITLDAGGQSHKVKSVHVHPNYRPYRAESWENDVALITLANPMTFNKYQKPIQLASVDPPKNAALILSGWGMTRARGPVPNHLQKATVFAMDNKDCQARHSQPIHGTHLCAMNRRGIGACQGDSGGPLVYNGKLVGIVSWVYPCAVGIPDVYCRVSNFLNFFQSVSR